MLVSPSDVEEIKDYILSLQDKYEFDDEDLANLANVASGLDFIGETLKIHLVLVNTLYSFGNAVNLAIAQKNKQ